MSKRIRFNKKQIEAAFYKGMYSPGKMQFTVICASQSPPDPSDPFQWIFGSPPPGGWVPTGGVAHSSGPTGPTGPSSNGCTGPAYPVTSPTVTPPDPNAPGAIGQLWFTYCSPVGTDPIVPTGPDGIEYAEVKAKSKSEDGCHCKKCRNFSPYAEKNQPDGSFVCYSCTIVM